MNPNPLIGVWKLVSADVITGDDVSYPLGKEANGYLIYTENGYMSAITTSANRPKFASGDSMRASAEEALEAVKTCVAYSGKYEIRGDKVIHHVAASFLPNWTGGRQERFFVLVDGRLKLSTPPTLVHGKLQIARLLWERV